MGPRTAIGPVPETGPYIGSRRPARLALVYELGALAASRMVVR